MDKEMNYSSRKEILANWQPDNEVFWNKYGKKIANQNLTVSTIALTLSFCIWVLWATIAAHLNSIGFHFTVDQLFTLAAFPGLFGATFRFLYTYMPSIFGGKNWTFFCTAILLIPLFGLGAAIKDPATPYSVFCIYLALIGLAGSNFSSSVANIGSFFPMNKRGTALGINAGIGNLGVSVVYFVAPFVIGTALFAPLFGGPETASNGKLWFLQNAVYIWIIPTIIILGLILKYMDNLPIKRQSAKGLFSMFSNKHTWILSLIYTCGFGAFIGYSAALSLLINKEFPEVSFAFAAFIGPFIGAGIRPVGGWISDKIDNGSIVTFWSLIGMFFGGIGVLWGIDIHNFALFFGSFLFLFLMTGFETGASFRMMPHIYSDKAQASLITGFTAAVGAYGAFFIPKLFGWAYASYNNVAPAFYILIAFTFVTILFTWFFYSRKNSGIKC